MKFNREAYDRHLVQSNCIKVGSEFELPTGEPTFYHIKFEDLSTNEYRLLVAHVSDFIRDNVQHPEQNMIIGVPDGATILGADLSTEVGDGRRTAARKVHAPRAKEFKNMYFAGPNNPGPGDKIILLEDSESSGATLYQYIDQLRKTGAEINTAIVLCSRREAFSYGKLTREGIEQGKFAESSTSDPGKERMSAKDVLRQELGVELLALTTVHSLVPTALKMLNIDNLNETMEQMVCQYGRCGVDLRAFEEATYVHEFGNMITREINPGDDLNNKLLKGLVDAGLLTLGGKDQR